jgi:hypothetical protein
VTGSKPRSEVAEPKSASAVASGTFGFARGQISWWFEAEGADDSGGAKVKVSAFIGTELTNWCHPGRYLLLGEGVEDGHAADHALKVYRLLEDETYDLGEDIVTKYDASSEVTYSDHFSILQPTFTTTETTPKSPSAMEDVLQSTQESITSGSELNPDPIAARGLLQTLRGTPDREPTPEESESASESARKRQVQQDESLAMSISEGASESARKRQVQQDESLAMSI